MSIMKYTAEGFSPLPQALLLHETLFHNANGYIGVRSCFEEGYGENIPSVRASYINGFYDFAEMKQAEKLYGLSEEKQTMLNVADPQGIKLYLDDEEFSLFHGEAVGFSRSLDMEKGITSRHISWISPKGRHIKLEINRMASFNRLPLFIIEYKLSSINYDGPVLLLSGHRGDVRNFSDANDPRVAAESFEHLLPLSAYEKGGASYLLSRTSASGLQVCTGVAHQLINPGGSTPAGKISFSGHGSETAFLINIKKGESMVLNKYCAYTDSLRYENIAAEGEAVLKQAMNAGIEALMNEQRAYLADFWKGAMLEINGDDDLNRALCFNLYQLLASAGKDPFCNVCAKGLSGEGYEGHYFWDTEMYIQPFFNLTRPSISKNLISYRYNILDEARKNAALLGHSKGALFPWRTIMGKECSGHYPSGSAQYHINSDIAHSVSAYYLATKDDDFMAEKGAEILFETARLWIDTGVYADGAFHIQNVTGPDEYTCIVNNNYYTNVSAKHNLEWAAKAYRMLIDNKRTGAIERCSVTADEVAEFENAAKAMYLPYDEKLGINPQDDSFLQKKRWDIAATAKDKFPLLLHYHPLFLYRHQVCKQADTVLAHFVYEDAQSEDIIRRSFEYYEDVTTHDSSLSTCIFSIVAAKLGMPDKAVAYFGNSAKLDLFDTHGNTKDGIHTANMGGTYMALVFGFGGLRIREDGLYFKPSLPPCWDSLRFRLRYLNSLLMAEIKKDSCCFTLLEGKAVPVNVYGDNFILDDKITVSASNCR